MGARSSCETCNGTGHDGWGGTCPACSGTGRAEELARTSLSSATQSAMARPGRRWGAWIVGAAFVLVFVALALTRPDQWASSKQPHTAPPAARTSVAPTSKPPAAIAARTDVPPASPPPSETPALEVKKTHPVTYSAIHRHAFGGQCVGTVRLDPSSFQYDSRQHPFSIDRHLVQRLDGPGFVDAAGKKWHFRFQGKTDAEVERLLRAWLSAS